MSVFFFCLFVFSAPRTVTVSSQMESRWSGYFSSFFTPADRAGASQPCGITVLPVWDKMDFFFPVRRFPSVLSAVRFEVFVCEFLAVWDETQLPFAASELLMMWVWSIIKWSWFGKPRPITQQGWKFQCVMNDFALIELARVSELTESWGGLMGRLNTRLWEWTSNALTLSPPFPKDSITASCRFSRAGPEYSTLWIFDGLVGIESSTVGFRFLEFTNLAPLWTNSCHYSTTTHMHKELLTASLAKLLNPQIVSHSLLCVSLCACMCER